MVLLDTSARASCMLAREIRQETNTVKHVLQTDTVRRISSLCSCETATAHEKTDVWPFACALAPVQDHLSLACVQEHDAHHCSLASSAKELGVCPKPVSTALASHRTLHLTADIAIEEDIAAETLRASDLRLGEVLVSLRTSVLVPGAAGMLEQAEYEPWDGAQDRFHGVFLLENMQVLEDRVGDDGAKLDNVFGGRFVHVDDGVVEICIFPVRFHCFVEALESNITKTIDLVLDFDGKDFGVGDCSARWLGR